MAAARKVRLTKNVLKAWSEVDLERGFLRLGDSKTGEKVILIGPPAIAILAGVDRKEDSPWVSPPKPAMGICRGPRKYGEGSAQQLAWKTFDCTICGTPSPAWGLPMEMRCR